MKTNFQKIDNRWVVETGNLVVVDYVQTAPDDYDEFLGEEVVDVCTGERLGINVGWDFAVGMEKKTLAKPLDDVASYKPVRKNRKKAARRQRIEMMVGTYWDPNTGMKKMGKTRFLRRRMYPNPQQIKDFEGSLPF